jgi:hypothetical protein
VKARAHDRCERCGVQITWLYSIHHRIARGMGGTSLDPNKPSNLLLLCGSGTSGCHGWVEHHRDDARAAGYLVKRGDDTTQVPYMTLSGLFRYLGDDGKYHLPPQAVDDQQRAGGQ